MITHIPPSPFNEEELMNDPKHDDSLFNAIGSSGRKHIETITKQSKMNESNPQTEIELRWYQIGREHERKEAEVKMSYRAFDIEIARAYNAGKQAILDQRDGKPFRSSFEYFKTEYPEYSAKINKAEAYLKSQEK